MVLAVAIVVLVAVVTLRPDDEPSPEPESTQFASDAAEVRPRSPAIYRRMTDANAGGDDRPPTMGDVTATTSPSGADLRTRSMLNKVPEVVIWFWIIKVLCTTVGESFADWINQTLGVGLVNTSLIFTAVLAAVLFVQMRLPRYVPFAYWLTVVVLSVTGTLYTDILTDQLHVPLAVSTSIFAVALAVVFGIWYSRERTLSIHSIVTTAAGGVLLARRPGHVRARHRRRRLDARPHRMVARQGGPAADGADPRCRDRLAARRQRRVVVLARLHPHPATRRQPR